ncbi:uncharacterized protein At1g76070-like [Prosopis cineraria]|uniref:uncharacterized protein At1g76070-like n=1 Tax=Prosopis cineraria TaxID=364024 RepID=UPI002410463A|nr:uncharacterized protein At1g76070-like [Prosopis cineraria]
MAKQPDLKKKILTMILPKAVRGALTFQSPPFSPRRDLQVAHKYHKHGGRKGSKMIPDEARRRSNYGDSDNRSSKSLEPTSPTVSCMGQIKHKKHQHQHRQLIKKAKSKHVTLPNVHHARPLLRNVSEVKKKKKQTSTFRRIFRRGRKSLSRASEVDGGSAVAAPALSQMKRFASGRGTLADFDWKAHAVAAPEEDGDEDDGILVSFSEPIVALLPKTEINLRKRRNMAPPPPLSSIAPPTL